MGPGRSDSGAGSGVGSGIGASWGRGAGSSVGGPGTAGGKGFGWTVELGIAITSAMGRSIDRAVTARPST